MQLDCIRLFRTTFTRRHNIMRTRSADAIEMHLPSLPYLGDVEAASEQMTSYVDNLTGGPQVSALDSETERETNGDEADQLFSSANAPDRNHEQLGASLDPSPVLPNDNRGLLGVGSLDGRVAGIPRRS